MRDPLSGRPIQTSIEPSRPMVHQIYRIQ